MNNVDLILDYVSGDMTREDAASFEKELASNQELREQVEEVSLAYKLIAGELQKRDNEEFRKKLLEIMEHPMVPKKYNLSRMLWRYILPLAGGLALLLAVFLTHKREDLLFSRYFHPKEDQVILAFNQGTRGQAETGILYYQLGHFQKSMEIMQEVVEQEQENQVALLYYLLSSVELDLQDRAIKRVSEINPGVDHQAGQALHWYTALALIKSGRSEEAIFYLEPLVQQTGIYQSDAQNLKKKMLK